MILSGKSYHEVKELLNVSHSFISEWKNQALFHGVESLRLQLSWETRLLKNGRKRENN
jgi:putative transposase